MCEFCSKHGEGKTWYLNMKNYSTELVNELGRKDYIGHFYHEVLENNNKGVTLFEKSIMRKMVIPNFVKEKMIRNMKENHFGQVVPLEDVEKILSMSATITRVACGCKWAKEKKESRLCYGISIGTPAWYDYLDVDYFGSPDLSRLENLSRQEALGHIGEVDRQGFVHSIWTFQTPFIGAICNCELSYCLAMRATVGLRMPVMFKAEYLAFIDAAACQGCRACLEKCQFAAIEYDDAKKICQIDRKKCFGCGVCRPSCNEQAISLSERRKDPIAAYLW